MLSLFDPASDGEVRIGSAADVRAVLEKMFGRGVAAPRGVVHVAAVARLGEQLVVFHVDRESAASHCDTFVLSFVRASVDAIVTTGEVLRAEPTLRHDLQGHAETVSALTDWRRSTIGRVGPARTIVLTSGTSVDLGHPIFDGQRPVTIFTLSTAPTSFVRRARDEGIDVLQRDEIDIRQSTAILASRYAARAISIEAGPSTARLLYRSPPLVDQLFLSVFEGPLGSARVVANFFGIDELLSGFESHASHRADGGHWTFHHMSNPLSGIGDGSQEVP